MDTARRRVRFCSPLVVAGVALLAIACSQDELSTSRAVHERGDERAEGVQAALQPKLVPATPPAARSPVGGQARALEDPARRDVSSGLAAGASGPAGRAGSEPENAGSATGGAEPPAVGDPLSGESGEGAPQRDPRAVPEGTPPHIARVFRRLPVSVRDGPPIGGIGASGIHIDKIALGDRYSKKRGCTGTEDGFSIASRKHVNVCFRVVHSRVDENVTVVWEKDGDRVKRRRGVMIPGVHAYRSRSFLVLRSEYAARWTVRVYSEDDVELASTSFTVVE